MNVVHLGAFKMSLCLKMVVFNGARALERQQGEALRPRTEKQQVGVGGLHVRSEVLGKLPA